jgi:succinate dehydrogenase / fumarate reductase cytochrome b subunit
LSSATTLSHPTHPGNVPATTVRPFLLRRLHSLTGLVFGGYLVVHLIINATLAQGVRPHDVYGEQVAKIHSLPFLPAIEWTFIYLPILFHTVYGIYLTVRAQPNVNHYPYAKNWFYLLQRISAVIIVLFMVFHVLSLKYHAFAASLGFDPAFATRTIQRHMAYSGFITWIVYPLGILASCYHLANGFWTAAITWGLTVSKGAQRRWGYACGGLFALTLIAGLTALIASVALAEKVNPNTVPGVPAAAAK